MVSLFLSSPRSVVHSSLPPQSTGKRFEQRIGVAEALAGLHTWFFWDGVQDEAYKAFASASTQLGSFGVLHPSRPQAAERRRFYKNVQVVNKGPRHWSGPKHRGHWDEVGALRGPGRPF